MKKIMSVVIIIAIVLTSIISVFAAETHTVETTDFYDGSASAIATSTYSRAMAYSLPESPFARAIFENTSGRINHSNEAPAGLGRTVVAEAYAQHLPIPNAPLKTSYASAYIGELEVICSQYY